MLNPDLSAYVQLLIGLGNGHQAVAKTFGQGVLLFTFLTGAE